MPPSLADWYLSGRNDAANVAEGAEVTMEELLADEDIHEQVADALPHEGETYRLQCATAWARGWYERNEEIRKAREQAAKEEEEEDTPCGNC